MDEAMVKKLIQLLYEYYGIFMVTFAMCQTIFGQHFADAEIQQIRADALPENDPNHGICHSGEPDRPCGFRPGVLTFCVLLILANHGVMMYWFYKIFKGVTEPYGTLGYAIQVAEIKREPFFKKFIIYTVAYLVFALFCVMAIPAITGGSVQGGMFISVLLVFGSITPFWVTVGSKVPLSKKCYGIPIRKLEKSPLCKCDNILNLLEDGIIEMASVAASGMPLEKAGTLLKEKLKFGDEDLQLLQACLTAEEIEEEASLFGKLQKRLSEQVSKVEHLETLQEATEYL